MTTRAPELGLRRRAHKRRNSDTDVRPRFVDEKQGEEWYGEDLYQHSRPMMGFSRPAPEEVAEKEYPKWRGILKASFFPLSLILISTSLVYILAANDWAYNRSSHTDWNNILFKTGMAPDDSIDNVVFYTRMDEVKESLAYIVDQYYTFFGSESIDYWEYWFDDDTNKISPMEMVVRYRNGDGKQRYFLHSRDDLGIFNATGMALGEVFDELSSVEVNFIMRHLELSYNRFCIDWRVKYSISFDTAVSMSGHLSYDVEYCPQKTDDLIPSIVVGLYVALCVVAVLSFLTSLAPTIQILVKWRKDPSSIQVQTNRKEERNRFGAFSCFNSWPPELDRWLVVAFLGDICAITVSITSIHRRIKFDKVVSHDYSELFLGLSCLFTWLRLVPIVGSFGPKYAVLMETMDRSAPFLARFFLGALPVFMGFAMFGYAVFSSITRSFRDVGTSSQTLFSILNGDQLYITFNDLSQKNRILGQIYLFTFMILFISCVTKVMLAGIEYFYFLTVPPTSTLDYEETSRKRQRAMEDPAFSTPKKTPAPLSRNVSAVSLPTPTSIAERGLHVYTASDFINFVCGREESMRSGFLLELKEALVATSRTLDVHEVGTFIQLLEDAVVSHNSDFHTYPCLQGKLDDCALCCFFGYYLKLRCVFVEDVKDLVKSSPLTPYPTRETRPSLSPAVSILEKDEEGE